MVSSVGYAKPLSKIAKPVLLPLSIAAMAYAAYQGRTNGIEIAKQFFTGPGYKSRIFALFMVIYNWKSLPLAWTVRIFNTMIQHLFVREFHTHGPEVLFHPVISQTHVTLLEVDYNVHKSNSTYFADLDVSRSHLASHLFARGIRALGNNLESKLVMDPSDPTRPAKGRFGVSLGAVHCSFKKELKPYQKYELWTRVLSWDRKWLYLVTHFVDAGTVKPKSWDNGCGLGTSDKPQEWEKKIHATAVSKYVWKMGRLTVHPAVVIEASGLLPARPDGWVSASAQSSGMVTPSEPVTGNTDEEAQKHDAETGWDWRRIESERLRGLEFAEHFAALDGLFGQFDAGENGALGQFGLG